MIRNIDKYKADYKKLVDLGTSLLYSIQKECLPKEFHEAFKKAYKDEAEEIIKKLPLFKEKYQYWYSESIILIKQLLPARLNDFIRQYEKPKSRKEITYENYCIEDYLQNLQVTRGVYKEIVVDHKAGIPKYEQQFQILKSIESRFESSLYDIRQLVQADLFDDEISAAEELNKQKYCRAAGAMAGVVLEKHLNEVCSNHNIEIKKKTPTISDFNEILKSNSVLDIPTWRFIQHLGDIRNLCDHNKDSEPTEEQVNDLLDGVKKIIKSIF